MTLLGLLLLIGVVVDDAIVVLENIFRHREHIYQFLKISLQKFM
ncbi:MAG: hypothetical protein EBV25_04535 [Methylophilaceae bacterium]|nr:hypothetical protein [Methylophilaceae bacterium]